MGHDLRNIENALGADIGATDQPTYFGIYGGQVQFLNQMSGCGTTTHTNDSYDVCDAYYHGAWPSTVTLGSMQSLFQDSAMQTPAVTVTCPSIAFTEFQDSSVASNLGSAIDIFGFGACDGNSVETGASPSPAPQFQRIVLPHSQSGPFGITVGGSTLTTLYFVESATHQLGSWDEVTGQLSEYPLPDYALSLACDTSYCYIPEPKSDKIAIFEIANSQMSEVAVPTANAYPLYATIELDPPKNGVYQEHVYFTEAQGQKLGIITPPYLETPSAVRRLSPHHRR